MNISQVCLLLSHFYAHVHSGIGTSHTTNRTAHHLPFTIFLAAWHAPDGTYNTARIHTHTPCTSCRLWQCVVHNYVLFLWLGEKGYKPFFGFENSCGFKVSKFPGISPPSVMQSREPLLWLYIKWSCYKNQIGESWEPCTTYQNNHHQ